MIVFTVAACLHAVPPDSTKSAQAPAQERRGLARAGEGASAGFKLYAPLRSHSTYVIDGHGAVAHE